MSDDSGFGWFTKKDTTTGESDGAAPKPTPAPVKKNVWNEKIEEPDFDTEGMSLEEIDNRMFGEEEKAEEAEPASSLPWAKTTVEEPVNHTVPKTPLKQIVEATRSNNPLWAELDAEREGHDFLDNLDNYVLCGLAGPPGSGKSGLILDSLSDEELAEGAEVWHIDYDRGGKTSKHAHHRGKKNIIIFDPIVMNTDVEIQDQIDYLATYERTMKLLKMANEQVDAQLAHYKKHGKMPKPYLKTLLFDGADKFKDVCENVMKIYDLGLGNDAVGVATKRVSRFSWGVRKTRYRAATLVWQSLMAKGVHVYAVSHMKSTYDGDGNVIEGKDVPGWLKNSDGDLQQIVILYIDQERDDMGRLTGAEKSFAVLTKNRTSLEMPGRHTIFERAPEERGGSTWYGWPSLKDGLFETDQSQKGASDE